MNDANLNACVDAPVSPRLTRTLHASISRASQLQNQIGAKTQLPKPIPKPQPTHSPSLWTDDHQAMVRVKCAACKWRLVGGAEVGGRWVVGCGLVVGGLRCVVCGLWVVGCGLWVVVCGLWFVGCGLWFAVEKLEVLEVRPPT
jgi:hypothetical protein